MSKENELKKIIISEKTLDQMTPDFLEKLKKENNVQIIVIGNDLVSYVKTIAHREHASFIILSQDEQKSVEDLMEETENRVPDVLEIQSLPIMNDIKELYLTPKKKPKPYVPRIIGKPNNKKRGGR